MLNQTEAALSKCELKLAKLNESIGVILTVDARGLEMALAERGYEAPILKYSLD